jgi:polyhydroxyalkanoate synthesis regulator phasin
MAAKRSGTNLSQAVQSGHEIWLAGIGALSTARKEGSKLFDLLVEEGKARTRAFTTGGVTQIRGRASGGLDKLERMFEQRLTKTLKGIGVPTAHDVTELSRRVAALDKHVTALARRNGRADGAKRTKRKAT